MVYAFNSDKSKVEVPEIIPQIISKHIRVDGADSPGIKVSTVSFSEIGLDPSKKWAGIIQQMLPNSDTIIVGQGYDTVYANELYPALSFDYSQNGVVWFVYFDLGSGKVADIYLTFIEQKF